MCSTCSTCSTWNSPAEFRRLRHVPSIVSCDTGMQATRDCGWLRMVFIIYNLHSCFLVFSKTSAIQVYSWIAIVLSYSSRIRYNNYASNLNNLAAARYFVVWIKTTRVMLFNNPNGLWDQKTSQSQYNHHFPRFGVLVITVHMFTSQQLHNI